MATKAQQRIEKAKRKYKVAEDGADSFLTKLRDSPLTVLWILAAVVAGVSVWVLWN